MDEQRVELSVLVQVKLDRFQVPWDSSTMVSWFSPRKEANYSTSLYMARLQDISSDLLNSTDLGRAGCGNGPNGPWSRFVKRMGRSEGELLWIYDHSWTGFPCSWPGRQQSYSPTITINQPFKSQLRNLTRWIGYGQSNRLNTFPGGPACHGSSH